MKKSMLILVALICLLSICSCKSGIEKELDAMAKPVYIASIGGNGSVLLRDSKGDVLLLQSSYYLAHSIQGSGLKNGDILIPKVDD